MSYIRTAALAGGMLLGAISAQAATLVIEAGELVGATGVIVNSVSYDVEFESDTCNNLFGTCTAGNFAFVTRDDADAAGQALRDQVFLEEYDTDPLLTRGCEALLFGVCGIYTFYKDGQIDPTSFNVSEFANFSANGGDSITSATVGSDYVPDGWVTYAKWTESITAIPLPATAWLLGAGVLGLFGFRRRS